MITKEATPDSGKIIIGGIDLDYVKRRHIPDYRRRIGVVFQDYKLLPSRTVFENVAFALEIAGMSNHEIENTVPKVLDLVGLSDKANRFPADLSGGERQRVSIARSVARQPKILIADEPTGNLDVLTSKEIIDLLQKINNYGTTILVTTHDANIVNLLKKRVITMRDGRTVEVLNTDAEGRLVMADGIALASESNPDVILDIATLTGAAMAALGLRTAALLGDEEIRDRVIAAGAAAGESYWPMPLESYLRKSLESPVADIKNIGSRYGGALTAGLFLKEFVGEGIPWAHLDIAGPAFNEEAPYGFTPKEGTGFGTATLVNFIQSYAK